MAEEKVIKDIINIHKNVPAVIDCFGPSGNKYRSKIYEMQNQNKAIRFSCNDWFKHFPNASPPDYWVFASTVDTLTKYTNQINQYRIPILYAYSLDFTANIDRLNCKFVVGYDQRHHGEKPNGEWCCYNGCENRMKKGRLSIQEELREYSGYETLYGSGDTVAVHMIAFAILMGCNPIYINGVDLNYSKGYANPNMKVPNDNLWQDCADRQIEYFNNLNESAKKVGIQILNLYHNAWYGVFENGYL